ncbi:MAG: calcium/sodium antiporter [Myxococcota bacterium]
MNVALWIAAFAAALAALVWAAGVFIRAAERIGLHFGLPPFLIGVSLIAVGTSLPELVSGVAAVLGGASEIAVGTAVGSNVTNILLILGVSALLGGGLTVDHELVRVDLPFLFGSALLLWMFGADGSLGWPEGIVCIGALSAYLVYAASTPGHPETTVTAAAVEAAREVPKAARRLPVRVWIELVVSAAVTQGAAWLTIESVVNLSQTLSVGTDVIATTAVALGTSLPELVVSARSAREGRPELAVGNVIGSNVFNALGVVGVSALCGALTVPPALAGFALPAMVGTTVLAFFVLQEREMTRWDGWLLIALYAGFLLQVLR